MTLLIEAAPEDAGLRLDVFLAREAENLSRTSAARLISGGAVFCEGARAAKKNEKVIAGSSYAVIIPEPEVMSAEPENISLDIVYEDRDVLVINKPRGMVVHPAPGNESGTLVNALLYHCGDELSGIGGVFRPGIVHRLDKDTSGLICAAKNDAAHRALSAQLVDHTMFREYIALASGHFKEQEFTVDAPVGRDPKNRKRMAVCEKNSRRAVTHVKVLQEYPGYTLAACRLETGRTHQIRVHLSYLGHPITGDALYGGGDEFKLGGQCLHARALSFIHPSSGERVTFEAKTPEYFQKILTTLEKRLIL